MYRREKLRDKILYNAARGNLSFITKNIQCIIHHNYCCDIIEKASINGHLQNIY